MHKQINYMQLYKSNCCITVSRYLFTNRSIQVFPGSLSVSVSSAGSRCCTNCFTVQFIQNFLGVFVCTSCCICNSTCSIGLRRVVIRAEGVSTPHCKSINSTNHHHTSLKSKYTRALMALDPYCWKELFIYRDQFKIDIPSASIILLACFRFYSCWACFKL